MVINESSNHLSSILFLFWKCQFPKMTSVKKRIWQNPIIASRRYMSERKSVSSCTLSHILHSYLWYSFCELDKLSLQLVIWNSAIYKNVLHRQNHDCQHWTSPWLKIHLKLIKMICEIFHKWLHVCHLLTSLWNQTWKRHVLRLKTF